MAQVDYFQRKLDDKRRLTIPTELRNEFASGVVITRGFQKYLHVYPKHVWDDEVEPLSKGDILDERIADLNVQFRMGKIEGEMTPSRADYLEQHLLDYAGIDKSVVMRAGWKVLAAYERQRKPFMIRSLTI
jgi:MraZ protein